jgi:hypothetical protein
MASSIPRVLVVVCGVVLVGLLAGLGLAAFLLHQASPARSQLQATAERVQRASLHARRGDPLGRGARGEHHLALALAAVPRVHVLDTATTPEGAVVVRLSAWATTGDSGLVPGDTARACLRVEALPGLPGGGWGRMGRVSTTPYPCPSRVALVDAPGMGAPAADLHDVALSTLSGDVEPRYAPCLSGSFTCPGGG